LIGLDFLHRYCKIIHTDLKPENVVVNLTKEELSEIMKKGQISTMNKNLKTLDVTRIYGGQKETSQLQTLLSGVETEGLTKTQKKKLKQKLKKQN